MFVKIFKFSLIINSCIPSIISSNYTIDDSFTKLRDPDKILDGMAERDYIASSYTFYKLSDDMMNPVIQAFCLSMGLSYTAYKILIDHNTLYIHACVLPIEPFYRERNFSLVPHNDWSLTYQHLFDKNLGVLSPEYWINHIGYDDYATKLYNDILDETNFDRRFKGLEPLDMNELLYGDIRDTYCTDEFTIPLFDRRLMKHLRDSKYIILGVDTGIKQEELGKLVLTGEDNQ